MAPTGRETLPGDGARGTFFAQGFALVLIGVALAACAQPATRLDRSSLAGSVAAEDAFALPPPGGPAVVGVVERRYSNAIQQDIVLAAAAAAPGQNLLRVQLFGPVGADGGDTALVDRHLAEADIRREMRELLPGIAMRRSPLYAQNSYGPFGYATGSYGANDLCLYAWQRIAAPQAGAPLAARGTIQVRLRLCQTGATEQGLLAVMYGYTINASFSGAAWNPYGSAPAADPRLGTTGQPIHPLGVSGPQAVFAPTPPAAPARRPAARRAVASPVASPPAGAPVVPPPPEDEAQQAPVVPPPPEE